MSEAFVPLLFAGDINVYSVSRAFYEEYGIKPYVYGKYNAMPCLGSKIMNYTANPKADVIKKNDTAIYPKLPTASCTLF